MVPMIARAARCVGESAGRPTVRLASGEKGPRMSAERAWERIERTELFFCGHVFGASADMSAWRGRSLSGVHTRGIGDGFA